jgi:hypothetical protein
MKTKIIRIAAILIIMLLVAPAAALAQAKDKKTKKAKKGTIQLFNGKDLNNWVFKLRDPSVDPATVFTAKDGIIHILGNPFGLQASCRMAMARRSDKQRSFCTWTGT